MSQLLFRCHLLFFVAMWTIFALGIITRKGLRKPRIKLLSGFKSQDGVLKTKRSFTGKESDKPTKPKRIREEECTAQVKLKDFSARFGSKNSDRISDGSGQNREPLFNGNTSKQEIQAHYFNVDHFLYKWMWYFLKKWIFGWRAESWEILSNLKSNNDLNLEMFIRRKFENQSIGACDSNVSNIKNIEPGTKTMIYIKFGWNSWILPFCKI